MVNAEASPGTLEVSADGDGIVSHAGTRLLVELADKVGLTAALSRAMAPTRERASRHDPGVVLAQLAVMLADGGRSLADLRALRDQPAAFGPVASDATAFRVIDSINPACLSRLRDGVATARERAWQLGAQPDRVVLRFDATLVEAHSRKEHAAGTFKHGFGHHPLLCCLDETREAIAGVLRPGNAGSNTAQDHIEVGDLALAQLPREALDGEILATVDGAGATHAFTDWCRQANIRYSVGFKLTQDVLTEALLLPDRAWQPAIDADGAEQPNAWVSELTDRISLASWPERSRLLCRAVKLPAGEQLGFGQTDGFRYEPFLTDQPGDIRDLDDRHRQHARVEDRIQDHKDLGLDNLPFRDFDNNQVWLWLTQLAADLLAWSQALLLTGELAKATPRILRYRLWHTAARISRHARQTKLRLDRHWPWATALATAFTLLRALPPPAPG